MRLWVFPLFTLTLAAQTPSFEVASIRPTNRLITNPTICGRDASNLAASTLYLSPESLLSRSESVLASTVQRLDGLVLDAYQNEVDDFDLPPWTRTNGTFAVSVNIPPNTNIRTCRKMLQNLLTERFHLVTAVETRDVSRYYVKVAKSGLKLKPVGGPPADPNTSYSSSVQDGGIIRYDFHGAPASRIFATVRTAAIMYARALGFSPATSRFRIAEVVDETGLTGYYDGEFQFVPTAPLHDELAESVEDAVSRQLGLTVELRKAPGKVLVIRSSDRVPAEN